MPSPRSSSPLPDDRFIAAFTDSQSALRGYCAAAIGNSEESRDVFQKVCLVLWKKVSDWDPNTPFLKWAFTVARFEVLSHVRDRSRDRLVFDNDIIVAMAGTVERIAEIQADRIDAMEKCLGELSVQNREVLTAHYVKGYKLREIAETQDRSLSAIKVSVMRLRQSLAKCIDQQLPASV